VLFNFCLTVFLCVIYICIAGIHEICWNVHYATILRIGNAYKSAQMKQHLRASATLVAQQISKRRVYAKLDDYVG
jgi:hypothetical protein